MPNAPKAPPAQAKCAHDECGLPHNPANPLCPPARERGCICGAEQNFDFACPVHSGQAPTAPAPTGKLWTLHRLHSGWHECPGENCGARLPSVEHVEVVPAADLAQAEKENEYLKEQVAQGLHYASVTDARLELAKRDLAEAVGLLRDSINPDWHLPDAEIAAFLARLDAGGGK